MIAATGAEHLEGFAIQHRNGGHLGEVVAANLHPRDIRMLRQLGDRFHRRLQRPRRVAVEPQRQRRPIRRGRPVIHAHARAHLAVGRQKMVALDRQVRRFVEEPVDLGHHRIAATHDQGCAPLHVLGHDLGGLDPVRVGHREVLAARTEHPQTGERVREEMVQQPRVPLPIRAAVLMHRTDQHRHHTIQHRHVVLLLSV